MPEVSDQVYRNGLFAVYRWVRDGIFSWQPVPVMLLVIILLIVLAVVEWRRKQWAFVRPWYRSLLNFFGLIIAWFYLSWGFNYSAIDVADVLSFPQEPVSEHSGNTRWEMDPDFRARVVAEMNAAYLRADTSKLFTPEVSEDDLTAIHTSVREYLHSINWQTPGRVAMRRVSHSGWMRRMGVAGIYMPFSGEGHADASYLALRQFFTLAHEYGHGYGITDEGECNFLAFMALHNCGVPHLEYAAWFGLADAILPFQAEKKDTSDLGSIDRFESHVQLPDHFAEARRRLVEDAMNYPPLIPGLAAWSNNLYLKSQGVEEGIMSYRSWPRFVAFALEESDGTSNGDSTQ